MITADSLTEDQIREFRAESALADNINYVDLTFEALGEWGVFWQHVRPDNETQAEEWRQRARARIATILNARSKESR